MEDGQLKDLADEQGTSVEALQALLVELRAQIGADQFYVFRMSGTGAAQARTRRERTLLAFLTPDAALAFARRNVLTTAPTDLRLRRLSILQLIHAMLREPAISALLFVEDSQDQPSIGQLPQGIRIQRVDLLRRLRIDA